jgi:hypothetical protein
LCVACLSGYDCPKEQSGSIKKPGVLLERRATCEPKRAQVALVDYDYANNLQIGPLIHRAEINNASGVGQQHFQGLSAATVRS